MTSDPATSVVSTTAAYLAMANGLDGPLTAAAWAKYEAAHPAIFEVYYRSWGDPRKRGAALAQVSPLAPLILQREARALRLVTAVSEQLSAMGLTDQPLRVVLLVGVGSSNGWVAPVDGRPTLFLALELLPDPPFDQVLIAHESIHTIQPGVDWPATVAADLWREGCATALSRQLCAGHEDSAYLWFDAHHRDWLRACEEYGGLITAMTLDNLKNTDQQIIRALFSMPETTSVPHRAGYWLADKMVTALLGSGAGGHELLSVSYVDAVKRSQHWLSTNRDA